MKRLKALWKNEERGQAVVEFALVAIIFFIVVFGTMDVGRAVWNYNTLAQATREGARFAVVHGDRCDSEPGCSAADLAAVETVFVDSCADEERFFSYRRAARRGETAYGRGLSAIVLDAGAGPPPGPGGAGVPPCPT